MALTSGLPLIVVPTTYAGSEMTSIYGITDGGVSAPVVIPECRHARFSTPIRR